jgi:hypothetical protein
MRAWRPAGLPSYDWVPELLSYIVVEELAEGVASLVVGPWPRVDDRGRLRFGDEDEYARAVASRDALSSALRRSRVPVTAVAQSEETE